MRLLLFLGVTLLGLPVVARAQTIPEGAPAPTDTADQAPPNQTAQVAAPILPEQPAPAPPLTAPEAPPVPPAYGGVATGAIPLASPADVALLGAWIAHIRGRERFGRYFAGITSLVVGPVVMGLGIWMMSDWQFHTTDDDSALFTSLGAVLVGVGGLSLATGIAAIAIPMPSEDRYEAFEAARAEGIDVRELGLWEGELRGLADLGRFSRRLTTILGIGLAVGGIVGVTVTALSDPVGEDASLFGYAISGGLGAAGLVTFGMSFIPSPAETAWRRYQSGEPPDGAPVPAVTAGATPLPGGGAVSVSGRF